MHTPHPHPNLTALALIVAATLASGPAGTAQPADPAARAETLWLQRAEDAQGARASAERARRMVEAHEAALAAQPESLERHWKLLRALHFEGDYALGDDADRTRHWLEGRERSDAARRRLAELVGRPLDGMDSGEVADIVAGIPEAAPIYLLSAIHWGRWGESTGRMQAARQGVAGKLRTLAEVVVRVDPLWDSAGGHRFLGRMHTEAPRIPFVTGWVDRDRAISELELAVRLAPDEPGNRLYLADALLRFRSDRRSEAVKILREILAHPPREERLVEDRTIHADAQALLETAR